MDLNRLNELKSEDVVLGKWDKFIPIVSTKESLINVIKTVVSQKESISNLKNEFNLEMRDLKQSISNSMASTKEYGDPFYNSIHASYFGEKDKYKCDNVSKELTEAIKYSQAKGYLTVYNSPMEREQPDEIRKYAQTIAYIRAHEDPIIGAIPDSLMRFVLGRGVKYKCPDYRIQTIIDKFWNMNNMEIFNKQALWLLIVESEFFPLYFLNSKNGDVYIREVQPSEIDIVETHKEDRRTILSYKRTFFQKDYNKRQIDGIDRYYPDINYYVRKEEGVLGGISEFEGKEGWRGETELMQFVKLMWNREVRGRVYLERVMKWAEWYKNWIIDRAIINHEKGRVVWILEISGRTNEVWERFLPAPAGGLTRISTPDRQWKPINATIKAEDAVQDGLFLLYQVAAGTGIPIHVLTQRTTEQVYSCWDTTTEALTPDGWKHYFDIDEGDIIGTVNPDTLKFEWQPVLEKFVYDYDGDMYHLHGNGTDSLVTPNHKLFCGRVSGDSTYWEFHRADSLPVKMFKVQSTLFIDKLVSTLKCPTFISNLTKEEWIRFIGYYVGDGSAHSYKSGNTGNSISNRILFEVKKSRKIEMFDLLLPKMGFYRHITKKNTVVYGIHNYELYEWVVSNFGRGSKNKKLSIEFINSLSTEEQKILFSSLISTDGCSITPTENGTFKTYYTISRELLENVYLLCLQLGYRVSFRIKSYENSDKHFGTNDLYILSISNSSSVSWLHSDRNISVVKYSGKVWCTEVKNHTMVTRRNGKIAVHGNSIRASDSPFSQLILDIQDTLMESYLKPMMRVVIRAAVKYGKLPSKVKIRKYVNEELRNIFRVNYDAYVNKELSDTLMVRQTKDLIEAYVGNISDNKGLNNTIKYEILESCFQVIESLNDASTRLIEGKDIEKSSKDFIKKASNMFETGFLITIDSEDVPVEITFPDMIRENLDETAKVIKIHRELGIVSKTTASAKAGYSPEQERYLLKTEDFESKEEIKAKAEEKANANAEQEKTNDGGNNPQGGSSTAGGTGTKPNAGGTKKDSK